MEQLYFNRKIKQYFLVTGKDCNIFCYFCRKIIEYDDSVIIQRSFTRRSYQKRYWCEKCFPEHKKRQVDEVIVAVITAIIPANSIIVPDYAPVLSPTSRKETVFSVATRKKKDNVEIVDRTKLAGRESWEGVQVGHDPEGRVKELDKPLKTENQALSFLNKLRDSAPAVEVQGVRRLE